MKTTSHLFASLLAVALAGVSLTACNKADDQRTVGQKLDSAISKTATKTEDIKAEVKKDLSDATITTSVNAELAKDSTLSALRINVDTDKGHVVLRGTAPDQAARDRAAQLAAAVPGVSNVDNQLVIGH